jgi:hypothetical protein
MERLAERVLTLERQLAGVQAELLTASARVAEPAIPQQVRIAKTTGTPQDTDTAFPITFLDGSFTETAGQQTATWQDRQNTSKAVVFNIAGEKIPSGTKLMVWAWNNRWWCNWTEADDPTDQTLDPMVGFTSVFSTELRDLTIFEDRVVEFDDHDLIGSVAGVVWNSEGAEEGEDPEFAFTFAPGDYLLDYGISGHSDTSEVLTSDTKVGYKNINYCYASFESWNEPEEEGEEGSWQTESNLQTLPMFAPPAGVWNTSSKRNVFSPTAETRVRMVVGTGQSGQYWDQMTNLYYVHWLIRPLDI